MQLTITRGDLVRILGHARSAVPSRTTIPIISHVRLHANGSGRLEISGTDLDRQCIDAGTAVITAPGDITVPADVLGQIAKSLPEGDVSIRYDAIDERVEIKVGRARYRLATLPAADFPSLASEAPACRWRLPAEAVVRMIAAPLFAAATDDTRPHLMGCHLLCPSGAARLRSETTDGHRLIIREMALPAGSVPLPDPGIIIPRQAMADIGRMADGAEDEMDIAISGTRIAVTHRATVYVSKLADGRFPDVGRVTPQRRPDRRTTVDRRHLAEAVGRMAAVLDAKLPRIEWTAGDGELALAASRGADHEASDAIPAEHVGAAWTSGISARYLLETLAAMRGERVTIEAESPGAPYRLTDDGAEDDVHVIMPLR